MHCTHASCFVHANDQPGMVLRGMGQGNRSGHSCHWWVSRIAPSRCTDPLPLYIPIGGWGAAWQSLESLALLSVGQPTQNWHWLGWLCQGARRRGVPLEPGKQGRKEPQVSIATQFSRLGALELSWFVTKKRQQKWHESNVTKKIAARASTPVRYAKF